MVDEEDLAYDVDVTQRCSRSGNGERRSSILGLSQHQEIDQNLEYRTVNHRLPAVTLPTVDI